MGILQSSIEINGQRRDYQGRPGQNLLQVLAGLDVHLPAACGGHGSCGLCACRLTGAAEPAGPREIPFLSPEQRAEGWRLACQVTARAGLAVELPPAALEPRSVGLVCESVRELSPQTRLIRLRRGDGQAFRFRPGQWARLGRLLGQNHEDRAFSFASAPGGDWVEFLVARVPGGQLTGWLHEHLAPGDELSLVGPYGEFADAPLDKKPGGPRLWVAGGSGIAPFRAMLQARLDSREPAGAPVFLAYAAHAPADLALHDWLGAVAREQPWFRYFPLVSTLEGASPWGAGDPQPVQARLPAFLRQELGGLAPGAAPADWEAWICGSAGLVEACRAVLRQWGLPEAAVHFDRFI